MRLAVLTMVWRDHAFLSLWMAHYGAAAGRENLYILNHGGDAGIRAIAGGTNVIDLPRDPPDAAFDRRRWQMLSDIASGLTRLYDLVIVGDVDELILPLTPGLSLRERLIQTPPARLSAPAGYELFPDEEVPFDPDRGVLRQAGRGLLSGTYTKPCLMPAPARIGAGGHSSRSRFDILPDLALLHLRFLPLPGLVRRDADRRSLAGLGGPAALSGWRRAGRIRRKLRQAFDGAPALPSCHAPAVALDILEGCRARQGPMHRIDMQAVRPRAFRLVLDEALKDSF